MSDIEAVKFLNPPLDFYWMIDEFDAGLSSLIENPEFEESFLLIKDDDFFDFLLSF